MYRERTALRAPHPPDRNQRKETLTAAVWWPGGKGRGRRFVYVPGVAGARRSNTARAGIFGEQNRLTGSRHHTQLCCRLPLLLSLPLPLPCTLCLLLSLSLSISISVPLGFLTLPPSSPLSPALVPFFSAYAMNDDRETQTPRAIVLNFPCTVAVEEATAESCQPSSHAGLFVSEFIGDYSLYIDRSSCDLSFLI